jgi:hypothetical protein
MFIKKSTIWDRMRFSLNGGQKMSIKWSIQKLAKRTPLKRHQVWLNGEENIDHQKLEVRRQPDAGPDWDISSILSVRQEA